MKLSYFPGCSAHGTGIEQDVSTRAVCDALGIDLDELNDWNCCGSTAAHAIGGDLADSLGTRNLEIAAQAGRDLLVPCAACYANLTTAAAHFRADASCDNPSCAIPKVVSLPSLLAREALLREIMRKRRVDLTGLKTVSYYGCLLVRNGGEVQEQNSENPTSLDRIAEICGTIALDWSHKTTCCGGGLTISKPDLMAQLSSDIVYHARRVGANCIVTACPMCHLNLESQQWAVRQNEEKSSESDEAIPVFYITELVGLALGLPKINDCLKRHLIDTSGLVVRERKAHV